MKSDLLKEPTPSCWYELFLTDSTVFNLRVHRKTLDILMGQPWATAPILDTLYEKHSSLKSFTEPNAGSWGFNDVFYAKPSEDQDWIIWRFDLPELSDASSIAIQATLCLFSLITGIDCVETCVEQKQLIALEHICLPDGSRESASFSAILTPEAVAWIALQPPGQITPLRECLRDSYVRLTGKTRSIDSFEATTYPDGSLHLSIPSRLGGCWVSSGHSKPAGHGTTMHTHNTDHGEQQLVFLAALAKLHDLIREAGY